VCLRTHVSLRSQSKQNLENITRKLTRVSGNWLTQKFEKLVRQPTWGLGAFSPVFAKKSRKSAFQAAFSQPWLALSKNPKRAKTQFFHGRIFAIRHSCCDEKQKLSVYDLRPCFVSQTAFHLSCWTVFSRSLSRRKYLWKSCSMSEISQKVWKQTLNSMRLAFFSRFSFHINEHHINITSTSHQHP